MDNLIKLNQINFFMLNKINVTINNSVWMYPFKK